MCQFETWHELEKLDSRIVFVAVFELDGELIQARVAVIEKIPLHGAVVTGNLCWRQKE